MLSAMKTMLRSIILAAAVLLPVLASAGYDDAIQNYSNGNYEAALKEFRQLSDQGDAQSTYFVGFFYHNGFGVPRDDAEAAKWFRRAAAKNHSLAQYYLGKLAEQGKGVEKDPVAAHMWYSLSVKSAPNERDAAYTTKDINRLERKMTPEQIGKAKELAKNWSPEKG
jgi:TPR repeat protein